MAGQGSRRGQVQRGARRPGLPAGRERRRDRGPGCGCAGRPDSPAAPRLEAFSARGRAQRELPRPEAARWAWPTPRALGKAVAAARPPEGRLPGTARGRRGIRAEALEPPLAFPLPPEPRWRWRPIPQPRAVPKRPAQVEGRSQGCGDIPTVLPGTPLPVRPGTARPGQGPGRLAFAASAPPVPASGPPQPARRRPGTHRVKQEQVCSQMPLTTPSPAARPPAQNQTVPNKSAIVAVPHPRRCPATWSGAWSPLHLPRGRRAARGAGSGPRSGDFRSPGPPALTPGPGAGGASGGGGSFLVRDLGSGLPRPSFTPHPHWLDKRRGAKPGQQEARDSASSLRLDSWQLVFRKII